MDLTMFTTNRIAIQEKLTITIRSGFNAKIQRFEVKFVQLHFRFVLMKILDSTVRNSD